MNCEHKSERISELRKKLEDLIDICYDLTDPEVIKLSRQLDVLICKHQSNLKNKFPYEKA